MPKTLTVRFRRKGTAGYRLIDILRASLKSEGWECEEPEGLFADEVEPKDYPCRRGSVKCFISYAPLPSGRDWILVIKANRWLWPISKIFGLQPSAEPSDILALAHAVQRALFLDHIKIHTPEGDIEQYEGICCDPRWCWDELPGDEAKSREPPSPSE